MPKKQRTNVSSIKLIDIETSKASKRLLDVNDKISIATKTGYSLSYIDYVINRKRYNKSIEKLLKKKINSILRKISK